VHSNIAGVRSLLSTPVVLAERDALAFVTSGQRAARARLATVPIGPRCVKHVEEVRSVHNTKNHRHPLVTHRLNPSGKWEYHHNG
jgi:hypothetical protein